MDPRTLRHALARFLGPERFRKFVQQGYLRGRLRFWQEQVWEEFVNHHLEWAGALEDLPAAIRICELHGDELCRDTVGVIQGYVDYSQEYVDARNRLFPHAAIGPISTEGGPFEGNQIEVWYCPACRDAYAAWESKLRSWGD